ncbi:MAG TPA: DMT family transporter [Chitinophagaceae bacterium]|nr:DMT family transporter [Chitinophagaceae bacterium]
MKKAFFQLHIAILLAGFTGVLGRLITLNEGLLVWYRLFISSVTMWILFSLTKKLQRISIKDILKLSGIGFLAALHWVSFYGSIKYANVSVALVCFSAVGFFTALFEPLFFQKRINPIEVLLGLIVIGGIYIIFHFDPKYKIGIILGVVCAVLLAFVMILIRQFVQRINPQTLLTYQLSGGLITLSFFMPFYLKQFPTSYMIPDFSDWMWLLVLAWFCSVLAFQFSVDALKKLTAFTVNLSFNLEPVYGIVLAFIIYHENKELGWSFFTGMGLIVLALCLQMWRVSRQSKFSTAKSVS